jgi:SRSO17 transposase
MGLGGGTDSESRFLRYVECLSSVIGHADRVGPLRDYCLGLMVSCGRKSVEPMAAITAPDDTSAQHQSLLHFIGNARWSDEKVLAKVREMVLPEIERHGPVEAWIIDDTGFPKQGKHSVGVSVQYCGQRGKQANCQAAVSLSLANHHASLPVAYQLYLPKDWAEDSARRAKAGVPEEVCFKTKTEIALDQIRWARKAGLPPANVLTDGGYGNDSKLREGISAEGLTYSCGVLPQMLVWKPGVQPSARPRTRKSKHDTVSVKKLALGLSAKKWRTIKWREGTNDWLSSRFARVRVAIAPSHGSTKKPIKEWLLIEWPKGEAAPTRYWLSTLPQTISLIKLVDSTKLRWRIERDYQELKQEVGLGHFEGRRWRGFHHHATLCIAAYGFLVSERETIPPSGPRTAAWFKVPVLPDSYRPRGSTLAA